MKKVTIRRFRFDTDALRHSDEVRSALLRVPGTEVEVIDGVKGEFTVLVGDRTVAESRGDNLPEPDEVVAAVSGAPAGEERPRDKW